MLCLKAEALGHEMYASHGVILPVNLGSSIQKAMHRRGRRDGGGSRTSDPSTSPSGDGSASCSGPEDDKSNDSGGGGEKGGKMCCYRSQLEQEVQKLQKQLQEEIDLHVALANAVAHNAAPLLNSPSKLPDKAQELLANISALEITVSKLEEELVALHIRLYHERNERRLAETHLGCLPSLSPEQTCSTSGYTWEEHIASLRVSKFGGSQISHSPRQDNLSGHGDQQLTPVSRLLDKYPEEEIMASCSRCKEGKEHNGSLQPSDAMDIKKNVVKKTHLQNPNQLSEEMVRCMRNIFLCLSESSNIPLYASSECLPSSSSPVGHLSRSSLTSFSDSSLMPSVLRSPSAELQRNDDVMDQANMFDPYRVNGKVNWRNIGSYGMAAEVSWMSVGKRQLEYAAEALKKFRFFVEQLAEVNPACLSHNEKLAFWINLYNALIMHAYLAYGVPRSDIKLFSLMQKVSYTIGGQSFSAADIEFVILKMKPPAFRPQLALILALHKFKISEEHRKYSVNSPEPLAVFALSCGMYSSPAVRIFTADNVHAELQESMRDYIRASIGLSDKGKLLVPKLLQCFAKGVVEDSLLVDWICRYLTPDQVTVVRDSASQRKQRLLGVRSFSLIPFDSRFRYLFLPDSKSSQSSSKGGSV
ncbi:uncharacterized protein [Elaeis guineensis]|uniref:Uncharacterized protein LOC105041956 n=1 Tax=Elaeis guineensis var. tenera TaxID=51953 RepID=A0A6I9QYB1_ELAGV|nr:uncharacterized protein LOC105041956 [Elaeis guineensis]XP_010917334.1 uncharacterized protein LOC105041956 [Elaeis guineensis]